MSSSIASGTFSTGSAASAGNTSDVCIVPSGKTSMRLTVTGLNGSNTAKTQMRTAGGAWADQTTYSSDQNGTSVTVAGGQEWRLFQITQQAIRDVRYKLDAS